MTSGARDQGREVGGISIRSASWLAWSVCGLTVVLIACAVTLAVLNSSDVPSVIFPLGLLVSAMVGGLVASRRPENPVGWFFLGSAICFAFVGFASGYAIYGLHTAPGTLPGARAITWTLRWLWVQGVKFLLCFIPLYLPNV